MGYGHHCGVAGVYGVKDAASVIWLALHALQHRGQESAGIVCSDGEKIRSIKNMGLLSHAVPSGRLNELPGHVAIGHVRYSTTGASKAQNIQPLVVDYSEGLLALAHNGNLVNAHVLRDEYEAWGSIFQTSTDSEILVHLMAKPSHVGKPNNLGHCLNHILGSYCFVLMKKDRLIAARDPQGFHPLCLGKLDDGYIVASETVALDIVGARLVREISPGEMVTIDRHGGLKSTIFAPPERIKPAHCIFEHIYFARPDSRIFGDSVHRVRFQLGVNLGREDDVEADVVSAIPDSGWSAAMGYAGERKMTIDRAFVRNHYVGRTFLAPAQQQRARAVGLKHNVIPDAVAGRRIILIDDSLVRGTTTMRLVKRLKDCGAKEVHLRLSCAPNLHPCYYGIDFPTRKELLAANHTIPEMEKMLQVDSLRYLSVEGMMKAVSLPADHYCKACFTGEYPVPPVDSLAGEDAYSADIGVGDNETADIVFPNAKC
ncbi:MAG: amidophosphoribosyltransferase [Planctomycetota bacterium]|jgi:amidophosphoribosyltransferase|nr:amidophosphoribosyltransferase [Planctomycetota bacterium]